MESLIYSFVTKEHLIEMLESFEACIKLPIQVIDASGSILATRGEILNYCKIFKQQLPPEESCSLIHINASRRAVDIGETYIFSCHANLNHLVFPLMDKATFLGSILVGPFLMEEPDSLLIADVAKHYSLETNTLLDMYEAATNIKVIEPSTVNHISKLLYFLFANLIPEGRQTLLNNKEKLSQQSKINESIQLYKSHGLDTKKVRYPYEQEKLLLTKVKTKNIPEARKTLNDLLGYVLFSEGSSLNVIKTRSIELCALLSRTAIEGGASTDSILRMNNQFLQSLQNIDSFDGLCFKLQEIVECFVESMFNYIPTKNSELVKKAVQYISQNYTSNITLEDVAEYVHLNPAYFSTLFKQSSGSTFKEYLNMVRIEESKRLLLNTDYTIIDIAIAVGFEDQSYFSKVFKKFTGLTPKQYR